MALTALRENERMVNEIEFCLVPKVVKYSEFVINEKHLFSVFFTIFKIKIQKQNM